MSDDLQANLEALSEDEGLTDNLTDEPASAVLRWAEQQIKAGFDLASVRRAVRAANRDEFALPEAAVAAASAALGAAASAVAAESSAPSAAPGLRPEPGAAVSQGVARGVAQAAPTTPVPNPAQTLEDAVAALRRAGAQGLAAATARSGTAPTQRHKLRSRRSRKLRFSTRRA